MANHDLYNGGLYFEIFLMPRERNCWRYAISPWFDNESNFRADSDARTRCGGQVSVGGFTNVNNKLYSMAVSVVAELNQRGESSLPPFDNDAQITIEEIVQMCKARQA